MSNAMSLKAAVSSIMTRNPTCVRPKTIFTEVANLFEQHAFHHLPVVDASGKCHGVISKSDYLQLQHKFTRLYGPKQEAKNAQFFASLLAREVMTDELVELLPDSTIEECIQEFLKNKVRSIIVQQDDILVGIITPYDILKYVYTSHY